MYLGGPRFFTEMSDEDEWKTDRNGSGDVDLWFNTGELIRRYGVEHGF